MEMYQSATRDFFAYESPQAHVEGLSMYLLFLLNPLFEKKWNDVNDLIRMLIASPKSFFFIYTLV